MFENVVVGVDGRPHSHDAIALALQLAAPGSKLTLVNVRSERASEPSTLLLEGEAQAAGLDAKVVSIRARSVPAGLHLQVAQQGADLLVVGPCARGALGRAALGDDARSAIAGAPCAVAISADGFARRGDRIRTIGVAYDGSPGSVSALETAREIAEGTGATLRALTVVLTVASPGFVAPVVRDPDEQLQAQAHHELSALPDVEARVVYGLPGDELASFGDTVDILIAGSSGRGRLERLIVGSTCTYLERHLHRPLLVVPKSEAVVGDVALIEEPQGVPAPGDLSLGVALNEGTSG